MMTLSQRPRVEDYAGAPDIPPRRMRRMRWDVVAVLGAVALVIAAALVGAAMLRAGSRMNLPFPPLFAKFLRHRGPGTPWAIAIAIGGVIFGPIAARRLVWRTQLILGYIVASSWTVSLALVDGWQRGWANRLATPDEYLHDLPRITNVGAFLRQFNSHILDFRPGSWTTHVSSHPPLATLVFWALDRTGLRGGGWAGWLVIAVGSSAGLAVAVTLRALGSAVAASRALPALVLFPGAVWVGVSADGLFTGVAAWGVACAVIGVTRGRRGIPWAVTGGLLLGAAVHLSYGLALMIFPVAAGCWLTVRARTGRRQIWWGWCAVSVGFFAVVVAFALAGFDWLEAIRLVNARYYQGIAARRPYGYFVWANFAALCLSAGPVVAAGLARSLPPAVTAVRRELGPWVSRAVRALSIRTGQSGRSTTRSRGLPAGPLAVSVLPSAAFLAVCVADLTGLSKAETERIWLPFAIWMVASLALLPARAGRWVLAGQVITALLVNHVTLTNW